MEHTPTPWVKGWNNGLTGPNTPNTRDGVTVHAALEEYVDEVKPRHLIPIVVGRRTLAMVVFDGKETTEQEAEANASFIVLAVNSHDELFSVLKRAVEHMENSGVDGLDYVKQVLAKAEGR